MHSDTIYVDTGVARYPIHTCTGSVNEPAATIAQLAAPGRLLLISDSNVAELYQDSLAEALRSRGRAVRTLRFPAGEANKSLATVSKLWDELLGGDIDRNDTVVAFGGGVTGDLAGFVAATTLRGIALIQMPTTMLSMADAAIGGKTGINVAAGKNLVGAFYQPKAVLCWLPTLQTLAPRELRSGMAEVVKSALIAGPEAVERVLAEAPRVLAADIDALQSMARVGAGLKADIVSRDVLEHGVRSHLNLGHTFGHAIEHAVGYGEWTHGEAVAAGMVIAARYSVDHGHAEPAFVDDVTEILEAFDLPTEPPAMSLSEWIDPIVHDKKRTGDSVKLILATGAGGVFSEVTTFEHLQRWMGEHLAQ